MSDQQVEYHLYTGEIVKVDDRHFLIDCTKWRGDYLDRGWSSQVKVDRVGNYKVGDIVEVVMRGIPVDE